MRIFEFNDSAEFVSQVAPLPLLESYGRLRTVRMGPDGALYVTTSNSPSNDDGGVDKILRVVPSLPPEFSSPHETHEVPENSSPGTVITTVSAIDPEVRALRYELGGVHAEFFSLANNKPGELQTKVRLDYEQQNSYDLVVTAFDDYGLAATLDMTIALTDVEEEGVVTISARRSSADAQTQFRADLTDDDGDITATIWRWSRSANGRSSWTGVAGETSSSYTVGADDLNQYLRATAFYEDRRGSDKTAEAVLSTRVGADDPPVTIEFDSTTYSVAEGGVGDRDRDAEPGPQAPAHHPDHEHRAGLDHRGRLHLQRHRGDLRQRADEQDADLQRRPGHHPRPRRDSVKLGFGTDLPPGVTEGTDDETTVTIIDDDPAVTVSFGAATYSADESGTGTSPSR